MLWAWVFAAKINALKVFCLYAQTAIPAGVARAEQGCIHEAQFHHSSRTRI